MGSVDDLFERYKDRGDNRDLYISRSMGYECKHGAKANEAILKPPSACDITPSAGSGRLISLRSTEHLPRLRKAWRQDFRK